MKHRLIHLITSLELGGANMMLYKLLSATNRDLFEPAVIVLEDKGPLGSLIESLGVPVYPIGMRKGEFCANSAIRLHKVIQKIQPDLIQAWTYHSNVTASILSILDVHLPVVWNIRHTPYDLKQYSKLTYLTIRYGAWLSRQPVYIIYNSYLSLKKHGELGYHSQHNVVIPNGFDTDIFKPSIIAYNQLRSDLNLPLDAFIIGMVNRYHPMKDHANFLNAAFQIHQEHPNVNFVLVGRGVDESNSELVFQIQNLNLEENVFLLGERTDVAEITAGFDVASMTSGWGDAFPNVVGEAMSCEVPCVVTDIGDSALLVGNTGIVVPPKDTNALANAWRELVEIGAEGRKNLGLEARKQIMNNYTLSAIILQYETLYEKIIA